MDRNLALEVIRVTEAAAIASAHHMGRGDEKLADQAAVDAMRTAFDSIAISGTVVIGEGERDEAPMLYIGEKVGSGGPGVDIALDPLEGTTILATGRSNSISVIALTDKGGFLHAPDTYMDKICCGPRAKGVIDITKGATWNLNEVARALDQPVTEITVVILDRPRHAELIREVREAGARIKLIGDGDVAAAVATCREETGVDLLLGTGGAPEGVLAAAALQCIGGDMQGKLAYRNEGEKERARKMGVTDMNKVFSIDELASGNCMFAATGVTNGDLLKGVRFFRGGCYTNSIVMRRQSGTVRMIETMHHSGKKSWIKK
ncbi:MAG: Fructose-1,6-bisphosphatase class 2 [Myxococcota bacterium]|nr:Fructose-1,6-bisphosphatase class 2 [Myxococcota bacterium]